MADAVANFLVEKLQQLLSENVMLIQGVADEFKYLLEEVKRLKWFLDDAANFHSDSKHWDQLVKEIQKTIHKAEDVIDKFLVQEMMHEKIIRWQDSWIKEAFQPIPILELPKKGAPEQDDEVVDSDEEANKVISRLVEGPAESLDVIPIVGMPGLEKTTLARKNCNDPRVSFEFFSIIWIHVGQSYEIRDVYFNIIQHFTRRVVEEYQNENVDALAEIICGFISKPGRCLIVLDDVLVSEVVDVGFGSGNCPVELVELGEKIAKSCNGVPHSVAVIAGALRGHTNKHDRERVLKIDWQRVLDVESLKFLFSKQFNQLFHLTYIAISAFFRLVRTVKKLTLGNTRFAWSEADKLGQLESLEVLKLKESAFMGESWKPEVGGFSQLQVWWIESLAELESWETLNLSFPKLRSLVLISYNKLHAVPLELADISNLQEMRLENTSKAVISAKEIQERKTSKRIRFKLTIFPPEP
ncbi:hypothetical protein HAX54_022118 [Datura stramonium]|uniref:Uncharacterized protein n=1 Tax=Datura stramonium TaxID=4076 RepID=A0ABS8S4B8_DATST|nr:hypothetical protein [Datura stramonium]